MGVATLAMALQMLAGSQPDIAIDTEPVTISADNHFGVAATLKKVTYTVSQFLANSPAKGLTYIDMSAGNLHLHDQTTRLRPAVVKRPREVVKRFRRHRAGPNGWRAPLGPMDRNRRYFFRR